MEQFGIDALAPQPQVLEAPGAELVAQARVLTSTARLGRWKVRRKA